MRNHVTLPNFNGVGANQTATVQLPTGAITFHKLLLEYDCTNAGNGSQANTEAHLTGIRIKVAGKTQRTFSAKQLNAINAYYGRTVQVLTPNGGTATTFLEVYFSEPWRRTAKGEDALAWGTNDISTLQVEVDIAAAATGPAITPRAVVEYARRPLGVVSKWKSYNQPVSGAGDVVNNTLPKNPAEAYQAIHAFPVAATDITAVDVKTDQVERFNASFTEMQDYVQGEGWKPQAAMFHIHFDVTGRVADALPMQYIDASGKPTGALVGDFRIDWTMNAANSFPFVALVLGPRD